MSEELDIKKDEKTNELSLLDLIAILLKYKWFIFIATGLAAFGVLVYCIVSLKMPVDKTYLPNVYTPKAEMLINDSSSSNSLSSALASSGLGSLAGMMGVSAGGGKSNSALASYMVSSYTIQDEIINKFYRDEIEEKHRQSIDELKQKGKFKPGDDKWVFPLTDLRIGLLNKIQTNYDNSTGVFTIKVEDKDPQLACDIINFTVNLLEKRFAEIGVDKNKLTVKNLEDNIATAYANIQDLQKQIQQLDYSVSNPYVNKTGNVVMDSSMLKLELTVQEQIYTSLKTQYETLKVTMASEQPVFQILEYAQIPDKKSGPSRGKLCVVVTMLAFCCSIIFVFLFDAIKNLRKDPVAMAKLHPNKKR